MGGFHQVVKRKPCANADEGCDMVAQIGKYCGRCKKKKRIKNVRKRLNKWSKLYDRCVECKGHKRPHAAKGLCELCYERQRER